MRDHVSKNIWTMDIFLKEIKIWVFNVRMLDLEGFREKGGNMIKIHV